MKADQKALLLLNGHKSHISVGLVQWAKERNIILFILPAHTSHILQPLDVGCYGPMQRKFNAECHKLTQESQCVVTRYNVCQLVCKVYSKALSADNLISSFRKPVSIHVIEMPYPAASLIPAEVFNTEEDNIKTEEDKNYNETKDGLPAHSQVKRPHKEKKPVIVSLECF